MRPRWLQPRLASRTGSAHRRRGVPCQDACGWWSCRDQAGEPVQVLVVSDGHGGARYSRSDAGSRLACAAALQEAQRALVGAITAHDPATWSAWLARDLPQRIVQGWHQAVERDWSARAAGAEAGFSSVPYGATLGVLVLTPHWWGHTGLGDWDLVRLRNGEPAQLLSEEAEEESGPAEATFSLCMERSERHFAARSGFHPLTAAEPAFELLLSTDGIRKSCGSDDDFLLLAQHLVALPAAADPAHNPELGSCLDHISREGSGDDVSAVIASWGEAPAGGPAPAGAGPLVLQPPPLPQAAAPPPGTQPAEAPHADPPRGSRRAALMLAVMAIAAACGAGAAWRLALGPFARPQQPPLLTPARLQAIRAAANALCAPAPTRPGDPDGQTQRIRSSLNQRHSAFTQLAAAPPEEIRTALDLDPFTALIALSKLAPAALVVEAGASPGRGAAQDRGAGVPICASLARELAARWTPPPPEVPQDPNR